MDESKRLRRRIAEEQAKGHGKKGKRYTQALRRDVSTYVRAAIANGGSSYKLGPELGLSVPTVYEWSGKARAAKGKAPAFRQMSVVAQTMKGSGASSATSRIVLKGPGGLRAVGLGVGELAELLRRLGC